MGSSQHELSNSSRELSSPPKPKGAGRLPEKTLGKAGGKPSGELDKPDARLGEAAEKTTETKVLEDGSTAYTGLAMCFKLMVEEHGELSESHAKAYHQCGRALLAWSRMEGKAFKHAMSGFNLDEFEEPKVEDTNNLAHDKRLKIEDGISETLDKNYNTQKNTSECHYNEVSDSEEEPSDKDSGDSEISEDKSETKANDIEETELFKLTNLVMAWEMLELAKYAYTKIVKKTYDQNQVHAKLTLSDTPLALGEPHIEAENYPLAIKEFGTTKLVKEVTLEAINAASGKKKGVTAIGGSLQAGSQQGLGRRWQQH